MSMEVVLSYEDSCLYSCDVALLQPGNWLNDKIIDFYFQLVVTLDVKEC